MEGNDRMEDIMCKIDKYLRTDDNTENAYNRVWEAIDEWFKENSAQPKKRIADLEKALEKARQFIQNGVELGYINMPEPPDSALETLPMIEQALSKEVNLPRG